MPASCSCITCLARCCIERMQKRREDDLQGLGMGAHLSTHLQDMYSLLHYVRTPSSASPDRRRLRWLTAVNPIKFSCDHAGYKKFLLFTGLLTSQQTRHAK